jgi:hypothetical protein
MIAILEALALTLKNLDCGVKLQVSHIFVNELHSQVWAERHRAKTVVSGLAGDSSEVALPLVTVNLWKLSYPRQQALASVCSPFRISVCNFSTGVVITKG